MSFMANLRGRVRTWWNRPVLNQDALDWFEGGQLSDRADYVPLEGYEAGQIRAARSALVVGDTYRCGECGAGPDMPHYNTCGRRLVIP